MLKFLFAWFDGHPLSYWVIAAVPTLTLLGWLWLSACGTWELKSSRRSELLFALLLLAVLFAWRWPFLFSADEYNPDESQLIAGAMTLRYDPIPWRGVDGFTSGPLNLYPLAGVNLLGLPLDYFTARVTAVLLVWGALLACYGALRSQFEPRIARVGVLPALAFFSTVTDWDFIHYSSEHLSLFLTAASVCCLLRGDGQAATRPGWRIAGCLCAGMLPLAKLQSGPIAAMLVVFSLFLAAQNRPLGKSLFKIWARQILAAATPSVFMLLLVAGTGQFEHFSRSYFLQNFVYMGDGGTLTSVARELWRISGKAVPFPLFAAISLVGAALAAFPINSVRQPSHLWKGGALLLIASLISILGPRRALLHYVLLSIVPLALLYGIGVGRLSSTLTFPSRLRLGLTLLILGGLPFGFRATQPVPQMFGTFSSHWREPHTALGSLLRLNKSAESRLAIWGWLPNLYVESGIAQGTRDGNSSWAMIPSPHREYYKQRFLSDLRRIQPDFFVDAVGIGAPFFHDRSQAAHESFAPLAGYIREKYQLVTDLGYARLYAKQGFAVRPLPDAANVRLHTARNDLEEAEPLQRESISPPNLPVQRSKTGFVQMMNPPAEIVWALDETTREIIFEYGFSPEAYRQNRTDGVELIFELRSPGVPLRHLFYRNLNPVRRPDDRGPVIAQLILPPFKSGSQLVARTTVGTANDGAWDLFFLGRVNPVRRPQFSPSQFPHFNRVPDAADADLSYLLQEPDGSVLILHAPSTLTYNLTGNERRLRFDFGFRAGAFSNGGQSDGATFQAELQRPAASSSQILFQKQLTPTSHEDDRRVHSADLVLPSDSVGAKLVIRIDAGKSNAWDWTYLTNFVLE